ncbi:putative F-box domain-containing protein [Rosa chinensis]|uniref:Putative F-box domain-containing protein n=1 Tax=Rosa chinensis TaxID=74649 RepID=A0A2P6SGQ4_ROSCH|nr:F-box protein At4g00755 [Rosa chinensis]XP_024174345.1 F-box protein At4g00755 [Rosa chinensis]XP_040368596.1 F-box protein At4g00755 [Rosa chinensis]XP_040368597.1 F-box protein At4g00755 [Rosa chinensis]PRQ57806.1 putative F-box domain-containing protein [Rosa chinensis]
MLEFIHTAPCMDWLNGLEPDMSVKVLTCLDNPKDLVQISTVSCTWRQIVVENGLCKKLCLRMFPQLSRVGHVIESNNSDAKDYAEVGSSNSKEWDTLEREHRVYAFLAHACTSFPEGDCISKAISASSTDNYPEESIQHTLVFSVARRASYWSSKGQKNPAVPEMLTYKLKSDFVIVTEINIHPFKAYFQHGSPIYSARGVRFRMGHAKFPIVESDPMEESCHDDKFEWTHTSQVFPMAQKNCLQTFKLPEPVLCIGGFLQIELVGRVQRQEMDDLFYICVSHVQVKGKSLGPAFSVETNVPSGLFVLKRQTKFNQPSLPENESDAISTGDLERHGREMLPIVNVLLANVDFEEYYE